jgi:hypothetical protein
MTFSTRKLHIAEAEHLLNEVGLSHRLNYLPSRLSSGEQQRVVAAYSFKEQSQNTFTQTGIGVGVILTPKGSPLQIVLNAIYHLEDMPGKIKGNCIEELRKERLVAQAIPFVVGHSYGGVRVNAIDPKFLTDFEYMPEKIFSFAEVKGGNGIPVIGFNDITCSPFYDQGIGARR